MAKKGFNLLKEQVEPPSVWTKIYDWMVGTARIIVVVVLLVVVIAFAIRIVVDVQGKQLDEKITARESIMRQYQATELRYRSIQAKTWSFRTSWEKTPAFLQLISELDKFLPQNVTKMNIQLDSTQISISGTAPSSEVGALEEDLKNADFLQNTEVSRVESTNSGDTNLVNFSIRTQIKTLNYRSLGSSQQT